MSSEMLFVLGIIIIGGLIVIMIVLFFWWRNLRKIKENIPTDLDLEEPLIRQGVIKPERRPEEDDRIRKLNESIRRIQEELRRLEEGERRTERPDEQIQDTGKSEERREFQESSNISPRRYKRIFKEDWPDFS